MDSCPGQLGHQRWVAEPHCRWPRLQFRPVRCQMQNLTMTIRRAVINDADNVWLLLQDFATTFVPEPEALN